MTPSRMDETRRRLLGSAYERLKDDSFVAFVDESYVVPENAHGSKTFYIATAYVAPVGIHEDVRADLAHIVDGDYWHTTEAHTAGNSEKIHELCAYISEAGPDEGFLLAIKSPMGEGGEADEEARVACLTALLSQLHSGTMVPRPALVVIEERRHQGQRAKDAKTIKAIRRDGLIGNMVVVFTSPSIESLLWVPDIVSFAQNHRERGIDTNYAEKLIPLLHVIPA